MEAQQEMATASTFRTAASAPLPAELVRARPIGKPGYWLSGSLAVIAGIAGAVPLFLAFAVIGLVPLFFYFRNLGRAGGRERS